jgi:hypothetical protein
VQVPHAFTAEANQVDNLAASFRINVNLFCRTFNDIKVFLHCTEEGAATSGRIDQFLVQKRIAMKDEQIANAAHDQTGRAAGQSLATQFFQIIPDSFAEKMMNDQLVVG